MPKQWIYGNVLLCVAVIMIMLFTICYCIPGLLSFYSLATALFFLFSGAIIIAFGCLSFRYSVKHGW